MPPINYYWFDSVPADSENIRKSIEHAMLVQNQLWFNYSASSQPDGSKYVDALKAAAKKTKTHYSIRYTKLKFQDFWEIVSAAKEVSSVYFDLWTLCLDSECNFAKDMDGWKINYLNLNYSGGSGYGNWSANPKMFENLIEGISKCAPLASSLKSLCISSCDITRDEAQKILNKYNLNGLQLSI